MCRTNKHIFPYHGNFFQNVFSPSSLRTVVSLENKHQTRKCVTWRVKAVCFLEYKIVLVTTTFSVFTENEKTNSFIIYVQFPFSFSGSSTHQKNYKEKWNLKKRKLRAQQDGEHKDAFSFTFSNSEEDPSFKLSFFSKEKKSMCVSWTKRDYMKKP